MSQVRNTLHDILIHAQSLQAMGKPRSKHHELATFIVEKVQEIIESKQQNWIGLTINEMFESEHYEQVALEPESDRTVALLLFIQDMETILEKRNHGRI